MSFESTLSQIIASNFINNTDHFLIHDSIQGYTMNNIEEQNMNDEPNPDVTGNMDAPTKAPSAKKAYTKPQMQHLGHFSTHGVKSINQPTETATTSRSGGPAAS